MLYILSYILYDLPCGSQIFSLIEQQDGLIQPGHITSKQPGVELERLFKTDFFNYRCAYAVAPDVYGRSQPIQEPVHGQ